MLILRVLSFDKRVVNKAALVLGVALAFLEHGVSLSPDLGLIERAAGRCFWRSIRGLLLVCGVAVSVHDCIDLV